MIPDKKKDEKSREEEFLTGLSGLGTGDIAALKRSAGGTIAESRGAVPAFYRILPYGIAGKYNEEIFFLIATLYGLNRYHFSGDFGSTMRRVKDQSSDSVDRRIMILLDSEFDLVDGYQPGGGEFAYRLRQCVKLADSKEVGIDWIRLLKDLEYWTHESKRVQKRWAKSYFGTYSPVEKKTEITKP